MTAAVTRRTGTFETGGETIYFEVTGAGAGDGDPVILSHGLGGNHASWWQQLRPLTDAGFTAVTWDQRGFGNSTRHSGAAGPGPAVDDLVALHQHLGLGPVHLVGQSMGGWVAMGTALALGEQVTSLTLTDTLAGVYTDEVMAALASARARPQLSTDGLGSHPALGPRFRAEHPDRSVLYQLLSGFGDKPPDDEMLAALGALRFEAAAVAALSVPAHLVVGSDDQLCPPDAMAAIAAVMAGAELTVLEGCGHSPYFEDPVAFNRSVIGFLERHRRQRPH